MIYKKLDPEFKKKWVEALRSGKYEQGRTYLRSMENRYCCLGVACDLFNPKAWELSKHRYTLSHSSTWIPHEICAEIYLDDFAIGKLVNMNDKSMQSFKQIADWIEENL